MTRIRLNQVWRIFSQHFRFPSVSIIGGYHGVNLGDMALGYAVQDALKRKKIRGALQTIYSLNNYPWKKCKLAIVGGGAVGYPNSLEKILKKYHLKDFKNIAFLGVDFNLNGTENDEVKEMLKNASWISCRNLYQVKYIQEITGRGDVKLHPDLVFSLYSEFCREKRKDQKREKLFLINVVPLYGKFKDGVMHKNLSYKEERPELYDSYDIMLDSYSKGIRKVAKEALEKGYHLEHVPFTPGDEKIAKIILKGMEVKHHRYTDSVIRILQIYSRAEVVFATRYHATIFGIKLGLAIIPMAYARKNEYLLSELGIERREFLSAGDLAQGKFDFPPPIKVKEEMIIKWENDCAKVIDECCNALVPKNF